MASDLAIRNEQTDKELATVQAELEAINASGSGSVFLLYLLSFSIVFEHSLLEDFTSISISN